MAHGIQKGTSATTAESRTLDGDVKDISKEMALRFSEYFIYKSRLSMNLLKEYNPYHLTGIEPDGGAFCDLKSGLPLIVFEAKKQQNKGNAEERAFKNYDVCREINPNISYVLFLIGEGARLPNGVMCETFAYKIRGEWNTFRPQKMSVFQNENGFQREEISNIMGNVLCSFLNLDKKYDPVNFPLANLENFFEN